MRLKLLAMRGDESDVFCFDGVSGFTDALTCGLVELSDLLLAQRPVVLSLRRSSDGFGDSSLQIDLQRLCRGKQFQRLTLLLSEHTLQLRYGFLGSTAAMCVNDTSTAEC